MLILGDVMASSRVQAQTQPDASLGQEASVVSSQGLQELVTGGATRGSGLFHSFEALNVGEGRSLYFSPANGIDHIFSRVTGSSASNINGTLGVLGNADLFLLNPNGIIFGANSQLDLAGSFVGSTASGLQFDGFEFSAVVPESVPLLTVTGPTGLNLTANTGSITNQSTVERLGLTVQPLQTLALVGGDIRLVGGRMTNRSGRIELAAVRSGRVGLTPDSNGWRLDYEPVTQRGNIELSEKSLIRTQYELDNPASLIHLLGSEILLRESAITTNIASSGQGIDIELDGDRIELLDGTSVNSGVAGDGLGGEVRINASQMLRLEGSGNNPFFGTNSNSKLISGTANEVAGAGGAIVIKTGQFLLKDGGEVLSLTGLFSTGAGGDIRIQATESLIAENSIETEFRTTIGSETRGSGQSGNLFIKTGQLQLDESYRLSTWSWVDGDGGDIEIEAESISLSGKNPFAAILPSGIAAVTLGSGNSGNIQITTQDLTISDSANLGTVVLGDRATIAGIFRLFFGGDFSRIVDAPDAGTGNAGNVQILAETVQVTGVNPLENSQPSNIISISRGQGDAGDLEITTQSLEITQGAAVGSTSDLAFTLIGEPILESGQGKGGDVVVNADRILVEGIDPVSGLPSLLSTQALGSGNSGNTMLNTRELTVRDGGVVIAGTSGTGNGGTLTVNATEFVRVDGQDSPEKQPTAIGTSAVEPSQALREAFLLPDKPTGDIGQLTINTPLLEITNGGVVSVEHQGIGDAGELEITTEDLRLSQDGTISAISTSGEGGNITIKTSLLEISNGGFVSIANEGTGNAGELEITAEQLRLSHGGTISATSKSGEGGNVDLTIEGLLSLRQGSLINAEALGEAGNGGNLTIEAGTILAIPKEDSDIIANAVGGNGGNITLRTGGLFGLKFQEQPNDNSSDITASSQIGLNGTVNIDLLAIDPSQGLAELPATPLNPNTQISTVCNSPARSKFVLTGRGGLPSDPRQRLGRHIALQDWRGVEAAEASLDLMEQRSPLPSSAAPSSLASSTPISPIVEAQGWQRDSDGTIRITAENTEYYSRISDNLQTCSALPGR